jgi:hypothetical protein
MKSFIFFLFIILIAQSCKKDKLEGDKDIFIGKWKWVYSIKSESYVCDNPAVITILTPSNIESDFYLDFNKKGCVTFFQNTEKKERYRLVFTSWNFGLSPYPDYYSFGVRLNNDPLENFEGFIKSDTLIDTGYFPFNEPEGVCISYTNYFVKELYSIFEIILSGNI